MPLLGVNIDHIATLRQARRESDPDPIEGALICERAGADSIVAHLREDRRHINDDDVKRLRAALKIRFNLEMSINPRIVDIACRLQPDQVTLVPERRQELTTEGGLDVVKHAKRLKSACRRLSDQGVCVSLFIDPVKTQIDAARELVSVVELHTGRYAEAGTPTQIRRQLKNLELMTAYGITQGLTMNAGHGLKYHNTRPVAAISGMHELNIGHSIMALAVFVGLEEAVKRMTAIARPGSSS